MIWVHFPFTHLEQKFPTQQTPRRSQYPGGLRCSQSARPSLQWRQWGGQWCWWTLRSRPTHSNTLWVERKRTEPSRKRWENAWRNHNRRGGGPRGPLRHHHRCLRRQKWDNYTKRGYCKAKQTKVKGQTHHQGAEQNGCILHELQGSAPTHLPRQLVSEHLQA